METRRLPLADAQLLVPPVFTDGRGGFKEVYATTRYRDVGINDVFVQDNLSWSRRGTLRGLHGDLRMAKLVQVLAGEVYDVIVDLRPESATYRHWHGVHLRGDEHTQLYVPRGFLHGFLALAEGSVVLYKQSALYDPASEFGVAWNDPSLAIAWPLSGESPLLSAKDAANPTLRELERRRP